MLGNLLLFFYPFKLNFQIQPTINTNKGEVALGKPLKYKIIKLGFWFFMRDKRKKTWEKIGRVAWNESNK